MARQAESRWERIAGYAGIATGFATVQGAFALLLWLAWPQPFAVTAIAFLAGIEAQRMGAYALSEYSTKDEP